MSAASSVSEMQVSNVAEESNASTASTAAAIGPIQQSAAPAAAVPQAVAGPSTAASDSQPQPGPSRAAAGAQQGSSGRSVSFTVSPKKAFMMRDQAAREATSGGASALSVGSSSAQPHCKT